MRTGRLVWHRDVGGFQLEIDLMTIQSLDGEYEPVEVTAIEYEGKTYVPKLAQGEE